MRALNVIEIKIYMTGNPEYNHFYKKKKTWKKMKWQISNEYS